MTRSFVLASALALSLAGASHADTIKRDLLGFRTGIKLEEQQKQCKTWPSPVTGSGATDRFSNKTVGWMCEIAPRGIFFRTLPYSEKVVEVFAEIASDQPPAQVLQDICLQFKTDCSSIKDGTGSVLDDRLVVVIHQQAPKSSIYTVHLVEPKLIEEEAALAPGPRLVPKL